MFGSQAVVPIILLRISSFNIAFVLKDSYAFNLVLDIAMHSILRPLATVYNARLMATFQSGIKNVALGII